MTRIAICLLLALGLILPGLMTATYAAGPAGAPEQGVGARHASPLRLAPTDFTTLRKAVKDGRVAFSVRGDGHNTKLLTFKMTNKTNKRLNVIIPQNEVFLSRSPSIQNMIAASDRVVSLEPGATIQTEIPTFCVATKSTPPPGAEEAQFDVGNYPGDQSTWKDIASIIQSAHLLAADGAYDRSPYPRERRESTIAQLAIWLFLGRRSDKEQDKITPGMLLGEMKRQAEERGIEVNRSTEQQLQPKVDELFAMVDFTVKQAQQDKHTRELATLPTDSPFDTFMQVGVRALTSGSVVEATELLSAAVDDARSSGTTDTRVATSELKLGQCYLFQGKASDAAAMLKQALAACETAFGKEYVETAEAAIGLGQALMVDAKTVDAVPLFERALQIREKSLDKTNSLVSEAQVTLGVAYTQLDRYGEAEPLLAKALASRIQTTGLDSDGVAEVNKDQGDLYTREGNYPKADGLYKRSLTIIIKRHGETNPYVCAILDGLINCDKQARNMAEADELQRRCEELKEKIFGAASSLLASVPVTYASLQRLAALNDDTVKIAAVTKPVDGISGTQIASATTPGGSTTDKPVRDKWAVVVGISEFATRDLDLKYSAKDAQDFATFLVKEENFAPDHVHVLTNQQATRENILKEIDKFLGYTARPDDLVVIYVSSHGSASSADREAVNYLIPYNADKNNLIATGIRMDEFAQLVRERVKSERVAMILDACHSGNMRVGQKDLIRKTGFNADQLAQGSGQLIICSSRPEQSSWEGKTYQNGIFTHHLIDALRQAGPTKPIDDVLFQEIAKRVNDEAITNWGEQQVPVMKSRWRGGRLILGAPPTDPVHLSTAPAH